MIVRFCSRAMEPPVSFWASIGSFIFFLPFFVGLLVLGIVKGTLIFPLTCVIMTVGNSAIVIGLWPVHVVWTWYSLVRTKRLGPVLKIILLVVVSALLVLWIMLAICVSILVGVTYGFLAPLVATFEAVGQGKTDKFTHCIVDGTWTTIKGSFTAVRDFADVCFHSFFSYVDEYLLHEPSDGKRYEIRIFKLLGGLVLGLLGLLIDVPLITLIALYKSPFMLFKGWHRLFHDLIGREGPFLETACVPFAGLAILLWPVAVIGAVVASFLASYGFGAFAAFIMYQESSINMGLSYIVSSLSIYDEYSNDVLGLPEGSCFPRLQYRKSNGQLSGCISRRSSMQQDKKEQKDPPSSSSSFKRVILDLKPIKLLEQLFTECEKHGQVLVAEGVITSKDIAECLSGKESARIVDIGLPAYCLLLALLRSIDGNSDGILLSDDTEITSMNRPKDTIFDWFFDPLMIMKEQIKAKNLSSCEQDYIKKLVLLLGDSERLKTLNSVLVIENEQRKAEINAFARRLQGITKSISRYPTAKRRFDSLGKSLSEKLSKNMGSRHLSGANSMERSRSGIARLFSLKSLQNRTSSQKLEEEMSSSEIKNSEVV